MNKTLILLLLLSVACAPPPKQLPVQTPARDFAALTVQKGDTTPSGVLLSQDRLYEILSLFSPLPPDKQIGDPPDFRQVQLGDNDIAPFSGMLWSNRHYESLRAGVLKEAGVDIDGGFTPYGN